MISAGVEPPPEVEAPGQANPIAEGVEVLARGPLHRGEIRGRLEQAIRHGQQVGRACGVAHHQQRAHGGDCDPHDDAVDHAREQGQLGDALRDALDPRLRK